MQMNANAYLYLIQLVLLVPSKEQGNSFMNTHLP